MINPALLFSPTLYTVHPPKKKSTSCGGGEVSDIVYVDGKPFTRYQFEMYPEQVLKAIGRVSFEHAKIRYKY